MNNYNWEFDFDPSFPVHLFEYTINGCSDQMHWHRYFEIGLCTENSGSFLYSGKVFDSEVGDVFITNNFETHVAITKQATQKYIFLIFLPSFISSNGPQGQNLSEQYLQVFKYNPKNFINHIPVSSPFSSELANLLRSAYDIFTEKSYGWQIEIDIYVRRILSIICKCYSDGNFLSAEPIKISSKMQTACEYINSNYNRHITVDEVAAQVGLYPSYFRHLFKETFQINFSEYVTQMRLSQARILLANTNDNINKIIETVGYTNITQFYRVFRKYFKITPMEFRKLNN